VQAVPNRKVPRLPPRRVNGRPWPGAAKAKWKTWAQMPHVALWQPSDWSFAMDSLELVARAAETDTPPVALLSEIRYREKEMGTTWDARQTLRLRYVASLPDKDGSGRCPGWTTTAICKRQKGFGDMTRLAQQLADGLAAAHKAAHPKDPQPPPSAEEVEQSGIDALRRAIYGTPPAATKEEQP
jgi:hypothetical protein